jgi:hypothetical protein
MTVAQAGVIDPDDGPNKNGKGGAISDVAFGGPAHTIVTKWDIAGCPLRH